MDCTSRTEAKPLSWTVLWEASCCISLQNVYPTQRKGHRENMHAGKCSNPGFLWKSLGGGECSCGHDWKCHRWLQKGHLDGRAAFCEEYWRRPCLACHDSSWSSVRSAEQKMPSLTVDLGRTDGKQQTGTRKDTLCFQGLEVEFPVGQWGIGNEREVDC